MAASELASMALKRRRTKCGSSNMSGSKYMSCFLNSSLSMMPSSFASRRLNTSAVCKSWPPWVFAKFTGPGDCSPILSKFSMVAIAATCPRSSSILRLRCLALSRGETASTVLPCGGLRVMGLASIEADLRSRRLTGNTSSRGVKGDWRLGESCWCHDPTEGHWSHLVLVILADRLKVAEAGLAPAPTRSEAPAVLKTDPLVPWLRQEGVLPSIKQRCNLCRLCQQPRAHWAAL
mmetsp:Transcript_57809/g.106815  ORF Transcript_57809/g.106815 Transcript_57809/m.106815 type:complete len:234 (+) Transcript_57809:354-1055(+)